jgi:hypothetical protein
MQPDYQSRRQQLLHQIAGIDRLRVGQISEQYYEKLLRSGEVRRQGPYYVLQRQRAGKKESVRIPADQIEEVRRDVDNYHRYRQLTQELAELTEQWTVASDEPESKKKPRRSGALTSQRLKRL